MAFCEAQGSRDGAHQNSHTITMMIRPIVQCAAFVTATNLANHAVGSGRFLSQSIASSTQLAAAPLLQDWTATSLSFFTSIRIPSALIAGASLSSLFSLTNEVDALKVGKVTNIEIFLLRLFHGLSLLSLLLSLNTIVSTTVAATTLLLGQHNGLAVNAYVFMNREIRYEFVTARWSFFSSLLAFIGSIAVRCFLEFDLKSKSRKRIALVVAFSTTALLTHLISYINSSLHCWKNLGEMSLDVFRLVLSRAWKNRKVLDLVSSALSIAAVVTAFLSLIPKSLVITVRDDDNEEDDTEEIIAIVDDGQM
jgi:hypothetical protein